MYLRGILEFAVFVDGYLVGGVDGWARACKIVKDATVDRRIKEASRVVTGMGNPNGALVGKAGGNWELGTDRKGVRTLDLARW